MTRAMRSGLEAALALLVLVGGVSWLSGSCEERVGSEPVEVTGERAALGAVAKVRGVTEPSVEWTSGEVASARHTALASRVLARIEDVRVRAGSAVDAGDVLVVLDARDLRARTGEMEGALRSAEARLDLAQRDHERTEELFRTGVSSQSRMDAATAALRAASAEMEGRREALAQARTAASFAELRSPVSGRVIDRLAEPGDTAVPGRPLLRIYDPTLLRVEAPVRESLAVRLVVGDVLRVEIPALGGPVEGRIDEIVPFAERGARTLLVKVSLPPTDARLFAGMFARIAIPAGERRRLIVPESAIERVGQLEFVTVVADGRAERRLVTTGEPAGSGGVEVLSGLREGERVRVPEAASRPAESERPVAAAEAVARFRGELGAALREALERGPEAAIEACRDEAPRIARSVATSSGIPVGRTSHRLRNPENAPEDWMLPLLEHYRGREAAAGSFRTVELGPRGTGYVEPIYLQPLCATCHGENIAPALREKIGADYPADEATGFRVGELRGLFWAVAPRDAR